MRTDISFVVMPFASFQRPSLGVSLLKANLARAGFSSKIHYFNLLFAEKIGAKLYNQIAELSENESSEFGSLDYLLGELIFSPFIQSKSNQCRTTKDVQTILRKIYHPKTRDAIDKMAEMVFRLQSLIPNFLEECVSSVLENSPKIVGFTSTFSQNSASLAVANRVKEQSKDDNAPSIVFGGANCEGEMGATILAVFDFVDYVCSGEGDVAFPIFVKDLFAGKPVDKINGIISRESDPFHTFLTSPVMDMDSLPVPDFEDFFMAFRKSIFKHSHRVALVIETSRGCWWGEKFQCTFCGLNGSTMKFRSKSVQRAIEEIQLLADKYGVRLFQVVDNILDMKYIENFFPQLSRKCQGLTLFYETKSNLSRSQLECMKQGGVRIIQPGIESLSTPVLNVMKKGVMAIQNIQTLKWCRELGIVPLWNVLWGFPKEPIEEYINMHKMIRKLVHLHPPSWFGNIILDRFSPYFLDPLHHGIKNVRPMRIYRFVYPLADSDLKRIAYHFDFDYIDGRNPRIYTHRLQKELTKWRELWKTKPGNVPVLIYSQVNNLIIIRDTRPCRIREYHLLADEEAMIYKICESVHSLPSILARMKDLYLSIKSDHIEELLSDLIRKHLIVYEDGMYLSLAAATHYPIQL